VTGAAGPAVAAEGLAVGWDGRPVVEGLDLSLPAGASLAVVGTNGSGKSTLIRTLVGLQPPVAGRLTVLGAAPGARPRRIGYVGQFHPTAFLLPVRARDVVAMGRFARLRHFGRPGPDDRRLVGEAMERMDVAHLAGRALRDLSGGQQQRVHIARALAARPDLLVLDEPASGLDVAARVRLAGVLAEERARGAAVVVATHDLRDALAADQALLLAGRVVAVGPASTTVTRETAMATFGLLLDELPPGAPVPVESTHSHCDHDHAHGHAGGPP
jgi:ABC-type Mn2+/Zn2+ transport system ATPase subunit